MPIFIRRKLLNRRAAVTACRVFVLSAILIASDFASAQIRLPSLNLPPTQNLVPLNSLPLRSTTNNLLKSDELGNELNLSGLRLRAVKDLLRSHADVIEADPRGEPVVRHEILVWSPSIAALNAARVAGFAVARERNLEGLGETLITLRVPDAMDTETALKQLRALDPNGDYDYNHLYTGSGSVASARSDFPAIVVAGNTQVAQPDAPAGTPVVRIGLIDGGLDPKHIVFRDATIHRWGCNNKVVPSAHGTAVGSLMIGKSDHFKGVAPNASLYAADVYCGADTGGAVDNIVAALAWFAQEKIAVINVSLVGPPNRTLERGVNALLARGHLLVAAVGNDGPAAPPLYPASYPGVVGVSAVDARRRVLPEAARGPQVMFAAPGSDMVAAMPGKPPYLVVRGTSFASPIVAAMLAVHLSQPNPIAAKNAIAAVAKLALGTRANEITQEAGYGVVGVSFRTDPETMR